MFEYTQIWIYITTCCVLCMVHFRYEYLSRDALCAHQLNLYRLKRIFILKNTKMLQITCSILLVLSLVIAIVLIFLVILMPNPRDCKPSITTASGPAALPVCSGHIIFEENFDELDKRKWQPEVTLSGGYGNGEFEWYVADDQNSFSKNGKLHIKPTLTSQKIGRYEVENGYVHLDDCTDPDPEYCERQADDIMIINPIRSARINTQKSFSFKYGRVEVMAKMPKGDWLWPAVWLMPTQSKYGEWPRSGEIDLVEARGNLNYTEGNGVQIGVQRVASTLHFGRTLKDDAYRTTSYVKNNATGYADTFHKYGFIWNESGIRFFVDDAEMGFVPVNDGFWKRGHFNGENIWASGTKMAPFDEEYHFIINLAVGGRSHFFPDTENQSGKKPWDDASDTAMKDFWTMRHQWLPTWHLDNDESSLIVDSVKVWAL